MIKTNANCSIGIPPFTRKRGQKLAAKQHSTHLL